MTSLLALITLPLLLLAAAAAARSSAWLARAAALLFSGQLAAAAVLCGPHILGVRADQRLAPGFRLDHTAALFVLLTTVAAWAALTHSVGFFHREMTAEHPPSLRQLRIFYGCCSLFAVAMYAVVSADNLGYLWIAVEATTLLSAPLVYFHGSRTSLEATWKYLIICSVGIAFAFFGTAILFAASQRVGPLHDGSLSLAALSAHARQIPRGMLRLAYLFALLGYGTKAGIFPLHAWLPDAHSEAPAPASALLSGALLNCALVALWRLSGLMRAAGDSAFVEATLLPMAVATVLMASLFLLKQRDVKRMLAYSSMENVGIIACAVALGNSSGFALQAVNHSLVKVALFLLAGNLLQRFGARRIRDFGGIAAVRPAEAAVLVFGTLAVAGSPPFGSFLAEWQILSGAADAGHILVVIALSIGIATGFIALMMHVSSVAFGEPSQRVAAAAQPHGSRVSLLLAPCMLIAGSLALGLLLTPAMFAMAQGVVR